MLINKQFNIYEFLLKELKRFEYKFGKYIYNEYKLNKEVKKQSLMISKFPIAIYSIDAFNFHEPALARV